MISFVGVGGADKIVSVDGDPGVARERPGLIWEEVVGRVGSGQHAAGGAVFLCAFVCDLAVDVLISILALSHLLRLLSNLLLGTQLLIVNLLVRPLILRIEPDSLMQVLFVDGLAPSVQRGLINVVIFSTQVFCSVCNITVTHIVRSKILVRSHRQQVLSLPSATSGPPDIGERFGRRDRRLVFAQLLDLSLLLSSVADPAVDVVVRFSTLQSSKQSLVLLHYTFHLIILTYFVQTEPFGLLLLWWLGITSPAIRHPSIFGRTVWAMIGHIELQEGIFLLLQSLLFRQLLRQFLFLGLLP